MPGRRHSTELAVPAGVYAPGAGNDVHTIAVSGMPLSAICPPVPVKAAKSVLVELAGPVVIAAPEPARASEDVTVVAVAAIGTCPAVMPESPLLPPPPPPPARAEAMDCMMLTVVVPPTRVDILIRTSVYPATLACHVPVLVVEVAAVVELLGVAFRATQLLALSPDASN